MRIQAVNPAAGQTDAALDPDPLRNHRIDLAAAFRWAVRHDFHEAVANHFSLAVTEDGRQFLVNPRGRHFSRIRASDLLLVDSNNADTMRREDAPDPTAWAIHAAMHRNLPQARCILHAHPKYATVLASLQDSRILPIDQNTMRFYQRIAIDDGFNGMGLGGEAERLATTLGDKSILIMGNHGVMVCADSVAMAYDELYYLERACETLITAYASGQPLRIAADGVARKTAQQWQNYAFAANLHFNELKALLDRQEPDYRD